MAKPLVVALAQLNPTVGDISGNIAKLREARVAAAECGADLVVTSEMYLCAYPAEDMVLKNSFLASLRNAAERLAAETADGGPGILLGMPWKEAGRIYNAAVLIDNGAIREKTFKYDLPNYGPFDEKRLFSSGELPTPLSFRGFKLGVLICEDMWKPDCAEHLRSNGAQILIVSNGSPYDKEKLKTRHKLAVDRAKETKLPLIYLNQIGGQDELVFDGASFALNSKGKTIASSPKWQEQLSILHMNKGELSSKEKPSPMKTDPIEDVYMGLVTGLRDYVDKNGFPGVVLGLSGGIDSALVATIAVDALGADRVWCVMLPSPYTSKTSKDDAKALAQKLGCRLDGISISEAMKAFSKALTPTIGKKPPGIVAENIQARIRGMLLMAMSNATGHMVLSTGNKSEMSVGYSTLYGDMCGGFAVLKDVYKTEVYDLANWRNKNSPKASKHLSGKIIPNSIIKKAPTAELRRNQKDQDTLPPYPILDGILECLIEKDMGLKEVIDKGYDPSVVGKVWNMLDKAEYKRRQSPPGVKISSRNLGRDRRYPITNKYKERTTAR